VTGQSRRLAVLFLLALAGVGVALGVLTVRVGGLAGLLLYTALVGLLLGFGIARARALRRVGKGRAAGRSCTCCPPQRRDPVRVI